MATRSRRGSICATASWAQMSAHCVGTKMHIVTPCASIRRRVASGSNVVVGVSDHGRSEDEKRQQPVDPADVEERLT